MCGANARMTKEHALPRWLGEPTGAANLHVKHKYEGPPGTGIAREWKTKGLGILVNKVCKVCNNGWMADLEGDARPILEPMILGRTQTFTGPRSKVIARWVIKTIGMVDLSNDPTQRVVPVDLPPLAKNANTIPEKLTIWASMASHEAGIAVAGRSAVVQLGERGTEATWMYQLVLRRLVIVAMGVGGSRRHPHLDPRLEAAMTQLWPQAGFVAGYPPRRRLNRKQVSLLLHMITATVEWRGS